MCRPSVWGAPQNVTHISQPIIHPIDMTFQKFFPTQTTMLHHSRAMYVTSFLFRLTRGSAAWPTGRQHVGWSILKLLPATAHTSFQPETKSGMVTQIATSEVARALQSGAPERGDSALFRALFFGWHVSTSSNIRPAIVFFCLFYLCLSLSLFLFFSPLCFISICSSLPFFSIRIGSELCCR